MSRNSSNFPLPYRYKSATFSSIAASPQGPQTRLEQRWVDDTA